MSKHLKYEKALKDREKDVEIRSDKIFSSLCANFNDDKHKMLIGEVFSAFYDNMPKTLAEETSSFEKVDLMDYWKFNEYGRTSKKR